MISKQELERIKSALNIVDVISEFVSLRKTGSNFNGVCPFHDDRRPSMVVSPSRQTYKCFVCGHSGDVIQFIREHENMSFAEAAEWCAKKAGIAIENKELTEEETRKAKDIEAMRIALKGTVVFFQKHLPEAQNYLAERGFRLTDKVIRDFAIGYAPEGNQATQEMLKAGFSKSVLTRIDVLKEDKNNGRVYDNFRDRIMFPYFDLNGNVTGFTGRFVVPKDKTGKYHNTSDTPLFRKGSQIYGLLQARRAIGRMNNVYLVEGQFDVLSMHAAGVENTVAGSGTALTLDQIRLLSRFTQSVTLVYDADDAGLKASLKNCELFLKAGFTVQCIILPKGKDPDNIASKEKENTGKWLMNRRIDFASYFADIFEKDFDDPEMKEKALNTICSLIACISSETLRLNYIRSMATKFDLNTEIIERKIRDLLRNVKDAPKKEEIKSGIHGIELIKELRKEGEPCVLTPDFDLFLKLYGDTPVLLVSGIPSITDIQQLRKVYTFFTTDSYGLTVNGDGDESEYMFALSSIYRAGMTNITVVVPPSDQDETEDEEEEEDGQGKIHRREVPWSYINYYVMVYGRFLKTYLGERTTFIERCADLISYADDSVRVVNQKHYYENLGITKGALNEILKPYLSKRKSRMAINAQRSDDDVEDYDPNTLPAYVIDNPDYDAMHKQCGFYPKLNANGEPVCYMFRNSNNSGYTMVGDFFMTPLLHIYSDEDDANKRVLKINRKYYKTPLYIEVPSKALLKKSTIEEKLINLEAVNFTDGEEKHWTKIKEYMSRNFVTCTEVLTYGNQQPDGTSRREDHMFYAFANGIFHVVDEVPRFDPVNELGVVMHNNRNYYLPAFSTIYAGSGRQSEKYEMISQLVYKDIPAEKQCSFEKWAELMDQVYKINDNGKWAILFTIMCAFRSNIHCIDRLFTAPFFMGPMSSGKTQIAISIRSMFISPKYPIFNLNIGTDAAMSTLMSTFRDMPVVLDEYNNKDISDAKFQALKGIVYDGDGRQKRKGTSGKEIENDKVYAPVILCGQETPQRDDNALMSRIIVCEVPKPKNRTQEEVDLFNQLKEIEDPDKIGLSNVLFDILKLRPLVMDKFRALKQQAYDDLKAELLNAGEIDRLMKTASLFLATCNLIENHTDMKLPFTYKDFLKIACNKIRFQVELISKTDKLATFFKAMDVMIDTKAIREGRDFSIDTPDKVTIKMPGGDKKEVAFAAGTRILFLRLSTIYTQFARSSYNSEESTQSTIEQNLRSHPSYIGLIHARRFNYYDTVEVPRGGFAENPSSDSSQVTADNTMVRKMEKKTINSSCIALNYDIFRELYDIDLLRSDNDSSESNDSAKQPLPF
jgi:DNA primase catalytic core